jgi:transposase
MKRKRRIHTAEFKARVALEALKGVKTINQIAQDEGVLPVQVSTWKKELQEGIPTVFQSGAKHRQDEEKAERDRARLERKVGQLVVEREFLEKKCEQLGIDLSERP